MLILLGVKGYSLTPKDMYNDGFRCIMTIEGRIKDCWFRNRQKLISFLITITLALLSESNRKKEVLEKI